MDTTFNTNTDCTHNLHRVRSRPAEEDCTDSAPGNCRCTPTGLGR